jgi:hypothetical protein
MVFPACLPITTDYFPDDVNLQSFYVFSNYNLLPEDVNVEVALQRAVYRQPLSTLEVFYQMICQRLSHVNIYSVLILNIKIWYHVKLKPFLFHLEPKNG